MLLNIIFDNMNSKLELVLIGIFFFCQYWFIMRKHNSLGLRLFLLCISLFGASCVWLYKDERKLKDMIAHGEEHVAMILSKATVGKNDHEVEVSFTAKDGKIINTKTNEFVSREEWNKFETGGQLSILYVADKQLTYVQQSIMRFKSDKIYLYYFSGFWLLLGIGLYAWLRKYKVGVDENTGNEWVEKTDGTVMLDERKSGFYRTAKYGNIISKLAQSFGKP